MRNGQSDPPDKARTPRFTTGSTVPRGVAKAIQFIRENLTARLDSDALAIASGLSERSLRRQFRHFTGQSPAAFHIVCIDCHQVIKVQDDCITLRERFLANSMGFKPSKLNVRIEATCLDLHEKKSCPRRDKAVAAGELLG